jgi:hypothetical protein
LPLVAGPVFAHAPFASGKRGTRHARARVAVLVAMLVTAFIVVECAIAATRGSGGGGGVRGSGPRAGAGAAGHGFRTPHRGSRSFHGSHSHFRGGVFFGGVFAPWYYPYAPSYYAPPPYYPPPPYYYYPPPVYYAPPPYDGAQVYSTPQLAEAYAQPPAYWWYYCAPSQAYYPYVNSCPEEWQRVAPQPPPPAPDNPGQSD